MPFVPEKGRHVEVERKDKKCVLPEQEDLSQVVSGHGCRIRAETDDRILLCHFPPSSSGKGPDDI